jgi:hypothetical protein
MQQLTVLANNPPAPPTQDERHFREAFLHALRMDPSQLPESLTPIAPYADATSGRSAEGDATAAMLALELYKLLGKYLNLLDTANGGAAWTQQDEREVEEVVSSIVRAGWTITLPRNGELGSRAGEPANTIETGTAYHSQSFAVGRSTVVQWGSDSSSDTDGHGYHHQPQHSAGATTELRAADRSQRATDAMEAKEAHVAEDRWDAEGGGQLRRAPNR